jgi:hypothetical protein
LHALHGTKCLLFSYFSLLGLLLSQKGLSYGSETVHGLLIHKNIKHIFNAQCFFLDLLVVEFFLKRFLVHIHKNLRNGEGGGGTNTRGTTVAEFLNVKKKLSCQIFGRLVVEKVHTFVMFSGLAPWWA